MATTDPKILALRQKVEAAPSIHHDLTVGAGKVIQ
jgi:hypothetical protein